MGLLSALGTAAGAYFGGGTGASIGGALGGALEGGAAGNYQGQATQQANQNAATAAQFRPVGITNTFGTSNFVIDPNTGQLTSAGYTLSPSLKTYQDWLMGGGQTGQTLQDVTGVQALGRSYLSTTPQQAAQDWMTQQQALLQPGRELQRSQLQNSLFNSGRGGLSVAQGGDLAASNPEMQAYYNSIAQQNANLAANAEQYGQQRTNFGLGLLSNAYQPLTQLISTSGAVEGLGQQPLELSASLAGRSASAGSNAAKYLSNMDYSPAGSFWSGQQNNPYNTLLNQGAQAFGNYLSGYTQGGSAASNAPDNIDVGGGYNPAGLGNWNWWE